jgi:hypothetical protein
MKKHRKIIIILLLFFFFFPLILKADYLSQSLQFFVEPSYDLYNRTELKATLRYISQNLYFYIEDNWWDRLTYQRQEEIRRILAFLGAEFDYKIYPTLTSIFGSEPKPGIDNDEKITILVHQIDPGFGGYFNTTDLYPQIQASSSNQREMIYLNSKYIDELLAKIHLAHEFLHLITFNQKEKTRGVSEDVWLNEARAEYTSTIMGYDDEFYGSNLSRRVKTFIEDPQDPLCEWKNEKSDYAVVNLFIQYLVDHYGLKIIVDSLKSSKVGIASINEALKKNGFSKDFSQIFTDWTIAVYLNDCQINRDYCYLSQNLKSIKVSPFIYYLPSLGNGLFSVTDTTKDWTGNWFKIVGGKDTLKFQFKGDPKAKFKVPYIIETSDGEKKVGFLKLNSNQEGELLVKDFGTKNLSFVFIPTVQTKTSNFTSSDPSYSFSWSVSTIKEGVPNEETPKEETPSDERISFLESEISRILSELNKLTKNTCSYFGRDLYYGLKNDNDVRCLQIFLRSQGEDIYPEGLITGNFLTLTKKAVIRFQEKYKNEILVPLGLFKGTGYFGYFTRQKANQLLSSSSAFKR